MNHSTLAPKRGGSEVPVVYFRVGAGEDRLAAASVRPQPNAPLPLARRPRYKWYYGAARRPPIHTTQINPVGKNPRHLERS